MLRNPAHLFRQDGIKLSFPLFDTIKLPRDHTQKLNEAVVQRHLKFNNIEYSTNGIMKSIFWDKKTQDIRMEHSTLRPYRYTVLTQAYLVGHLPTIARTQISKRLEFIANKVLPVRSTPMSDFLFLCKEGSYFAPLEEIERQMICSLYFLNSLKQRLEDEYDDEDFTRSYWKSFHFTEEEKHKYYSELLLLSYSTDSKTLLNQLAMMAKQLKDPDSELSIICYPTDKKFKNMISNRTIAIKRWARAHAIDIHLYRCLSVMGWLNKLDLIAPIIDYINNS